MSINQHLLVHIRSDKSAEYFDFLVNSCDYILSQIKAAEESMRVHRMEVALRLKFTDEERRTMSPSFCFGDAEEQISYAVHSFGSQRVADLIVEADDGDIAFLALTQVDLKESDKARILETVAKHGLATLIAATHS